MHRAAQQQKRIQRAKRLLFISYAPVNRLTKPRRHHHVERIGDIKRKAERVREIQPSVRVDFRPAQDIGDVFAHIRQGKLSVFRLYELRQIIVAEFEYIAKANVIVRAVGHRDHARHNNIRHAARHALPFALLTRLSVRARCVIERQKHRRHVHRLKRPASDRARDGDRRHVAPAFLCAHPCEAVHAQHRQEKRHALRHVPHAAVERYLQQVASARPADRPRARLLRRPPERARREKAQQRACKKHREIHQHARRIPAKDEREQPHRHRGKRRKAHVIVALKDRQLQPGVIPSQRDVSLAPAHGRQRIGIMRAVLKQIQPQARGEKQIDHRRRKHCQQRRAHLPHAHATRITYLLHKVASFVPFILIRRSLRPSGCIGENIFSPLTARHPPTQYPHAAGRSSRHSPCGRTRPQTSQYPFARQTARTHSARR